ncbi:MULTISPECIES: glycosyltransferase family 2 protein [Gordonia]|uniref:glycosyltransferase family 2 protein n=1 Tax=Gordonia TaxID=2053 RepID=UPI000693949B|nr:MULTISPECIES: glycosyltransferase family A protein [Gordonia]ASR04582.1 Poly-beta-1,6-N-acetyl-D-glucosamine synthase [Gordonia rubripertincta]
MILFMQITLVVPCFNEEAAIGPCLDAVLGQTRQFDEIIVVDNNSTDRTLEVVRRYVDRLPIRVLTETRQGVAWASQCGYNAASGDVIARIDADTRVEPAWAAVVDEYLSGHPEVDGVGGFSWLYDMPRLNMRKAAFARAAKFGADSSGTRPVLVGNNMAIRKSAWDAARVRVKNLPGTHEDLDVTYALKDAGRGDFRSLPGMVVSLSPRTYLVSPKVTMRYLAAIMRTAGLYGRRKDQAFCAATIPINIVLFLAYGIVVRRLSDSTESRVSPVTR